MSNKLFSIKTKGWIEGSMPIPIQEDISNNKKETGEIPGKEERMNEHCQHQA